MDGIRRVRKSLGAGVGAGEGVRGALRLAVFAMAAAGILLLSAGTAFAQAPTGFDVKVVEGVQRIADTRLIAMDFYADWCVPCKMAIPHWKRIQDRFRSQGFRLVVVKDMSQGACARVPASLAVWKPDREVCDLDGQIQDRWGVTALPTAFLWDWQGNLLMTKRGEDLAKHGADTQQAVDAAMAEMEARIADWFEYQPRVALSPAVDERGDTLADAVRNRVEPLVRKQLLDAGRFNLLPSAEAAELLELYNAAESEGGAGEGEGGGAPCRKVPLQANTLLTTSFYTDGEESVVSLSLYSLATKCQRGMGVGRSREMEKAVRDAVQALLYGLMGDLTPKPIRTQDVEAERRAAERLAAKLEEERRKRAAVEARRRAEAERRAEKARRREAAREAKRKADVAEAEQREAERRAEEKREAEKREADRREAKSADRESHAEVEGHSDAEAAARDPLFHRPLRFAVLFRAEGLWDPVHAADKVGLLQMLGVGLTSWFDLMLGYGYSPAAHRLAVAMELNIPTGSRWVPTLRFDFHLGFPESDELHRDRTLYAVEGSAGVEAWINPYFAVYLRAGVGWSLSNWYDPDGKAKSQSVVYVPLGLGLEARFP